MLGCLGHLRIQGRIAWGGRINMGSLKFDNFLYRSDSTLNVENLNSEKLNSENLNRNAENPKRGCYGDFEQDPSCGSES
ncbi:hypothetical protein BGZ96_008153 [Linnemannia gamsii]|uniref:Uncharacterized protein n=1 Tax=Linnemannia gamsii TaxID=64522 RepID=A0ABQ7JZZ7_9FUNG|nr:hypothetical protein BGZ96_008153 [Linnemannia gamsii]